MRIRRSRSSGPVVLCLAVGLAVSSGVPAMAPARAATRIAVPLHVYDQNIRGGTDNDRTRIQSVVDSFGTTPNVLLLEEICYAEYQQLSQRPDFAGWSLVFTKETDNSYCTSATGVTDVKAQGELIAAPYPLRNVVRSPLTVNVQPTLEPKTPPDLAPHLTCADVGIPGVQANALRACVTHLRPGFSAQFQYDQRTSETGQIASVLGPVVSNGQHVILGGDFNSKPDLDTMDSIYALNNAGSYTRTGWFIEMDQFDSGYFSSNPYCTSTFHCRSGANTSYTVDPSGTVTSTGPKIDYIFYSSTDASGVGGYVAPLNGSDQKPLRSTVSYSLPAA